ncbi:recombinase family protein [Cardinium endosymbiont of Nabis limbatus]|uniref:recombinase family protein n=1 Tax=Cardinium endosymbiont of Nabis limbatus TaxID=3066217 RepID=UPI003AF3A215
MLIGYARISKSDGSQTLDLQIDALKEAGISENYIYKDEASGSIDDRQDLTNCLKTLREGDTLVVWKLDRLGRNLKHLVNLVQELHDKGVGLKVLTGQGANIDTTTPSGKMVFAIFAALAEFERALIRERTIAGLAAARARGRKGGRKLAISKVQLSLAQAAMENKKTNVNDLCKELGISRTTLYRYLNPNGALRNR